MGCRNTIRQLPAFLQCPTRAESESGCSDGGVTQGARTDEEKTERGNHGGTPLTGDEGIDKATSPNFRVSPERVCDLARGTNRPKLLKGGRGFGAYTSP